MNPDNMTRSDISRESRKRRTLILGVVLLAAVGALLYFISQKRPSTSKDYAASHAEAKDVYYCPMHPSFRSDKPGSCPVCSMKLVKMEKAAAPTTTGESRVPAKGADTPATMPGMSTGANTTDAAGAATSVFVAPERQQLIGMRSVAAAVQPVVKEIRTVGKVAFDETKVTHIHTKVSGYIEDVFADYVGKHVRRGEALFTIYSPDLVATQQEYLLALKSFGAHEKLTTSARIELPPQGTAF
jgi:membrane fusion protein, copper/silver efflux system